MEEEENPTVKLLAPAGSGSVSFGGNEYPVDENCGVVVPASSETTLKAHHGFTDYTEEAAQAPEHKGRGRKAAPQG